MFVDSGSLKRACAALREFRNSDSNPYGSNARKQFLAVRANPGEVILRTSSGEIKLAAEGTDQFEATILMPLQRDLLTKGKTEIVRAETTLKVYRNYYAFETGEFEQVKDLKKLDSDTALSCLGRFQDVLNTLKYLEPAIGRDETRPHLNIIHITNNVDRGGMIGVATDGYRMHFAKFERGAWLVNDVKHVQFTLATIKALFKLKSQFDPGAIVYASDDKIVIENCVFRDSAGKSSDIAFPPYDQVIPKAPSFRITVKRTEIAPVLKELDKSNGQGVILIFKEGSVHFEQDTGYRAMIPVSGDTTELQFSVAAKYLKEACASKEDQILLQFDGPLDPLMIIAGKDTGIVMPRRI